MALFRTGLRGWHRAVLIAGSNLNDFTDLGPVAHHLELSPALRAVALQRSYLTVFFNLQLCARR